MAEGLRLVGACPRCGGVLTFAEDSPSEAPEQSTTAVAPHMVLGFPQRF